MLPKRKVWLNWLLEQTNKKSFFFFINEYFSSVFTFKLSISTFFNVTNTQAWLEKLEPRSKIYLRFPPVVSTLSSLLSQLKSLEKKKKGRFRRKKRSFMRKNYFSTFRLLTISLFFFFSVDARAPMLNASQATKLVL